MSSYVEFGIFMTLLDGKIHRATELAENFEISTKTVYRSTNKLVYSGFPISTTQGKNGGIFLASNFNCSTWFFTEDELAYLLNLVSSNTKIAPLTSEVIYSKLKQHIKQHGLSIENKKLSKFFIDETKWYQSQSNQYQLTKQILEQCTGNKKILIFYRNNDKPRLVDPYCIVLKEASCYLYAFCNMKNDFRFFKIDKIKNWSKTNIEFKSKNIDFSTKPWNTTSFFKVSITFQGDTDTISDINSWTTVKKIDNNKYSFEATYNKGLVHKLIEYGNSIKILEPEQIICDIKNECQNIISLYS